MHELYNGFIQVCCQARTPVRLDASGRWFICLTVFRVGHEVEGALKASGLLPFLQKQWDILLDDSLAIPGVPNFIAFEGVPWCSRHSECHRRETSADWCAAEKHVKDWLLKEQPPTLSRNLWLDQRSSHAKPQGGKLVPLADCAEEPPVRPAARRKKQVTIAWCKEAVSRLLQHKTHEQLVDCVCGVGTEHQQHTDALSQQLVHQERLSAMQQAQLQQLKRKCEFLGRELVHVREAWAESCPGERP